MDMVKVFGDAIDNIASAVRDKHTRPEVYDFFGVVVRYENNSFHEQTWDEWADALDKWMPLFDEHGWLDGLKAINIGDANMERSYAAGHYDHKVPEINYPQSPTLSGPPGLVGDSLEYALIHEVTHHVHVQSVFGADSTIEDVLSSDIYRDFEACAFETYVSQYAAYNVLEAVAETCAGIMLGKEYPDVIRQKYLDAEGPVPFRNWEEPSDDGVDWCEVYDNLNIETEMYNSGGN